MAGSAHSKDHSGNLLFEKLTKFKFAESGKSQALALKLLPH